MASPTRMSSSSHRTYVASSAANRTVSCACQGVPTKPTRITEGAKPAAAKDAKSAPVVAQNGSAAESGCRRHRRRSRAQTSALTELLAPRSPRGRCAWRSARPGRSRAGCPREYAATLRSRQSVATVPWLRCHSASGAISVVVARGGSDCARPVGWVASRARQPFGDLFVNVQCRRSPVGSMLRGAHRSPGRRTPDSCPIHTPRWRGRSASRSGRRTWPRSVSPPASSSPRRDRSLSSRRTPRSGSSTPLPLCSCARRPEAPPSRSTRLVPGTTWGRRAARRGSRRAPRRRRRSKLCLRRGSLCSCSRGARRRATARCVNEGGSVGRRSQPSFAPLSRGPRRQ